MYINLNMELNIQSITAKSVNYLLFGLAIAISVNFVTDEKVSFEKLVMIAVLASFIYATTDYINNKEK